jgi:NADH-ubiquinone oxidoreductase chain 5
MTFYTMPNAPVSYYNNTHEQALIVCLPYLILSLFSVFFGYVFKDLFTGPGSDFLAHSLFIHPSHITLIEAESLYYFYKLLPAIVSILSAVLAFIFYQPDSNKNSSASKTSLYKSVYSFFSGKYYFDVLYNKYLIGNFIKTGLYTSKVLDKGIIELVGPYGLSNMFYKYSGKVAATSTGIISLYALSILLALILIIFVLFVPSVLTLSSLGYSLLFVFCGCVLSVI